jgi:hypothetical protein
MKNKVIYTYDSDPGTAMSMHKTQVDRFCLGSKWIKFCIASPVSMSLTFALDNNVEGYIFHQIGLMQGPNWWSGFNPAHFLYETNYPTVIDKLPEKLREKLRIGTAMVLYDQSLEGFPLIDEYFNYYEAFHAAFIKYNLPPNQFVITTSNLNEGRLYDHWCSTNGITSKMTIVEASFFAAACAQDTFFGPGRNTVPFSKHVNHKRNNKIQLFNCLNRVIRVHRVAFVSMLNYYGLLKNNKVSHDSYPNHFKDTILINQFTPHPAFERDNVIDINQKLPLILDTDQFHINKAQNLYEDVYLNTWVSIITETFYYEYPDQALFFSEKIYKPMRAFHPFILLGINGSIRELKASGFKTFSNWWDESYDDIEEPTARMDAICKLLLQLSNKSKDEWEHIYLDMKPVLDHNYHHLLNTDWLKDLNPKIIKRLPSD